jgi:hypothetical protein
MAVITLVLEASSKAVKHTHRKDAKTISSQPLLLELSDH